MEDKSVERVMLELESENRILNFRITELERLLESKEKDLEFYKEILLNLSKKKEL